MASQKEINQLQREVRARQLRQQLQPRQPSELERLQQEIQIGQLRREPARQLRQEQFEQLRSQRVSLSEQAALRRLKRESSFGGRASAVGTELVGGFLGSVKGATQTFRGTGESARSIQSARALERARVQLQIEQLRGQRKLQAAQGRGQEFVSPVAIAGQPVYIQPPTNQIPPPVTTAKQMNERITNFAKRPFG